MKTQFKVRRTLALLTLCMTANLSLTTNAQCVAPSLTFENPVLVSGSHGQEGATYKFPFVTSSTDAYITIDSVVGGAILANIDATHTGYQHAWQPVVDGPSTPAGHEYYIRWSIRFKNAGTDISTAANCLNLSVIDVDGDNVRMREFVESFNCVQHLHPSPSVLNISMFSTSSGMCTRVLGQVSNKLNIDTNAHDTRVTFEFGTTMEVQLKTGALVANGSTGPASTDRHFSLYFKNLSNMSTLPVRLLSFGGKALGNRSIELKWVTELEVNNKQFEVQRSFNGKEFSTVGIVFSQDGNGVKAYKMKDVLPAEAPGKIFYRLKQVDIDGKFAISKIITVGSEQDFSISIQAYPNPVVNELNLSVENSQAIAALRIVDINGREVYRKQMNGQKLPIVKMTAQQAGMQTPGIYVAELILADGARLTKKLIKQ